MKLANRIPDSILLAMVTVLGCCIQILVICLLINTGTYQTTDDQTVSIEYTAPTSMIMARYIPIETTEVEEEPEELDTNVSTTQHHKPTVTYVAPSGDGVLTPSKGINYGPSGKETYYNLDMSGCIVIMNSLGYYYDYWIRDDGVKMFGEYVMIAANLSIRPKGSLVETSLGTGIVVDTGGFATYDATQIDIAVTW